jgi:hypothetical protein
MRKQSIESRIDAADARSRDLAPIIVEIQEQGAMSLREIAAALMDRGIPTARGGGEWTAAAVSRVLQRAGSSSPALSVRRGSGPKCLDRD